MNRLSTYAAACVLFTVAVFFLSCDSGKEIITKTDGDLFEFTVTGTSHQVSIYFTDANCKPDSIIRTSLPYKLLLSNNQCNKLEFMVRNEKVAGSVWAELRKNDRSIAVSQSGSPRATVKISYSAKATSASQTVYEPDEWQCGIYNGHTLFTGPKGGCYYLNLNGNKSYVDRIYCSCD
ncbi:hypothetical protein [Siphonobacter aquaeclarae]|uniref:Lipoprotein n=1 Tax=Siphonobacter aquaeclarae TaxID=563176 RepID=A0A1G9T7I5_9BACT|nr:hypothetical protein [Siphonobacter aquaeclarae]SDM43606.1 hypothetical protein SAMN04488090_3443 [Siphonobacter aquaeclarae]